MKTVQAMLMLYAFASVASGQCVTTTTAPDADDVDVTLHDCKLNYYGYVSCLDKSPKPYRKVLCRTASFADCVPITTTTTIP